MPTESSETRALSALPVGAHGEVAMISEDTRVMRRLIEMGLLPGTPIQLTRRAPLGDPIEIRLRGYQLTLRKKDAKAVRVRCAK